MTGTALDVEDYIRAYEMHAVNYIEKPVVPQIALAQIKSLLQPPSVKIYQLHNHFIKFDNQLLTIDNKEFQLRQKDSLVFALLLDSANTVVTRNHILRAVWNNNSPQLNNVLDSSISHIKKIVRVFPWLQLKTVYGSGYRLEVEKEE